MEEYIYIYIYIRYCTHNIFNFNKYFICIIFLFILLILQDQISRNLCVQIFGTSGGTSLPLISFFRRLISTSSMTPKRTQVMHVNKGHDKIIIAQSRHDAATGLMTRSKAKSTSSLSTKQISESVCLLKLIRTCDEHHHSSPRSLWGQRAIVLVARENSLQHYKALGINLLTLLPMATLALTHTLDRQLECQRRKTTPIIPSLVLLPSR